MFTSKENTAQASDAWPLERRTLVIDTVDMAAMQYMSQQSHTVRVGRKLSYSDT
jgi:hypothetical protein